MSIGQMIVLAAVIGAFVLFAVVLAWGDYRAQQLAGRIRESDREDAAAATASKTKTSAIPVTARWPQRSDDRLQDVA